MSAAASPEFAPLPPTSGGGRRPAYDYADVAARLIARPGEWIRLEDMPTTIAARIRNGLVAAFRPVGAWEATTRTNGYPRGRVDVYVRFIGQAAAEHRRDGRA